MKTTIPSINLDPPGAFGELYVVDAQEGDSREKDLHKLQDKEPREFTVVASLGKHSELKGDVALSISDGKGESYIYAHPDALVTKLYSPEGVIFIHHNSMRELCRAEYVCRASSANEARTKFIEGFAPYLDHVSYLGSVPIHITQITTTDKKNGVHGTVYTAPYSSIIVNPHKAELFEELIPIYALYREAKNANSPFYRFLCFYKILEGIYLILRPKVFKTANTLGVNLDKEKEVVPSSGIIQQSFSNLVGLPIKKVFDERFQPEFRNKVAHYLLDSTTPLNVSDFGVYAGFGREICLIEACVRVVVDTHSKYLSQIKRARA